MHKASSNRQSDFSFAAVADMLNLSLTDGTQKKVLGKGGGKGTRE